MSVTAGTSLNPPIASAVAGQRRMMGAFLVWGFSALLIGVSIGPLQALNYAGIDLYPGLRPILQTYYQGLTIHGVLNAYIFTFFFTAGVLVYLPARELELVPNMTLWRLCFATMGIGTLMLLYAMFDNSSSVLWTFYPPLKGSPFFYFGMTLVAFGSLMPLPIVLDLRARWKARNPGRVTPLITYMSTTTMLMWLLAAGGVMIELVVQLDPWSVGMTDTVDPIIGRTLFWWTGHPIVYFWLMPAYVSWYGLLPRQIGGKLVSDSMARLTFALLLVFSLPVGSHHQFDDPGFSAIWRGILTALTLSVALPSLITAFTIGLTLEYAGRLRGGRGLLGWFTALPWGDPSVAAQVLSMLTFIFGGAGGIVNGSWQLDNIVHNTIWIPGHFHITVGTATAMTFMGMAFWMLPHLTGRRLLDRRGALLAVWLWFSGMSIFSLGMHWAGLFGVPRRAWVSFLPRTVYDHVYASAHVPLVLVGVGGAILWLAAAAFFTVFFASLFTAKLRDPEPIPFAQVFAPAADHADGTVPALTRVLEHLGMLTLLTAAATAAAYIPIFWPFLNHITAAPGWKVW